MDFLIETFGIFLEIISLTFFFFAFLGMKFSKVKKQIIAHSLIGTTLILLLKLNTTFSPGITFLCSFLLLFILASLIFKISFIASFISVVLGLCILLLGELLSLLFLGNILDVIKLLEADSFEKILIALPHILLINLIGFVFIRYNLSFIPWDMVYKDKNDSFYRKYGPKYMVLACITMILIIIVSFTISYNLFYLQQTNSSLLFVTIVSTIYLLFFTQIVLKYESQKLEKLLEKQHEAEIKTYFQVIKSQRHDFVHHLSTLYGLIAQKKFQDTEEYIEELIEDVRGINEIIPIHHPAISAILLTLQQQARGKNINMSIIVKDSLVNIPCKVTDINRVLGNLISNAIDELSNVKDQKKWIEVLIEFENLSNEYIFTVTNSGEIDEKVASKLFENTYTTKSNNHEGIGLVSTKRIMEKYEGLIYLETASSNTSFIARIPAFKKNKAI
ncbi:MULTISPECIES: sensor histidine kinase [unclassified Peribacillus]|uniref:sensor histidine kinase n=1 Tax=unclassified Peribacillus TaxID=2675266 RepID=UPI00366D6714